MVIDTNKKDMHLVTRAISCIMQRWLLPGIVVLIMLGFWLDIERVKIAGLILASPGLWAYAVMLFVLLPIAALKRIQMIRKLKKYS